MSKQASTINKAILASLICLWPNLPALAGAGSATAGADSFAHNSTASGAASVPNRSASKQPQAPTNNALAFLNPNADIVHWFEAYDVAVATARPTDKETYIMSRPINQELERVQQFTDVVAALVKRYHLLVKQLKSMPVQPSWTDIRDLRDATADFYGDEADVYEDMIKPRPAARTIEELDASLNDLQSRAEALKRNGQSLLDMDTKIRQTFGVHAPYERTNPIATNVNPANQPHK